MSGAIGAAPYQPVHQLTAAWVAVLAQRLHSTLQGIPAPGARLLVVIVMTRL